MELDSLSTLASLGLDGQGLSNDGLGIIYSSGDHSSGQWRHILKSIIAIHPSGKALISS